MCGVVVVVAVVVVVLTLTRTIKSVVTGQAPVTLGWRNTAGKKHKPKVVHAYTIADAINASAKKNIKLHRESAYDVPGPYWSIRLTTRA